MNDTIPEVDRNIIFRVGGGGGKVPRGSDTKFIRVKVTWEHVRRKVNWGSINVQALIIAGNSCQMNFIVDDNLKHKDQLALLLDIFEFPFKFIALDTVNGVENKGNRDV